MYRENILYQGVGSLKPEFEKKATDFLSSEKGKKVQSFAASAEGQKLRARYAKEGEELRAAVNSGDMASAEAALRRFLASSDGQALAEQIKKLVD